MTWTDDEERAWREMTTKREENKKEVGKLAFIADLRKLADSIERGDSECGEVNIEFVRGPEMYGYEHPGPVVARRITVTTKCYPE